MWIRWVKNSLPNSGVLAVEGLPWNLKKSTFRKKVEALMVLIYPINKHKVPIIRKRQRKSKWVQKGLAEWSSIQLSTFFFFLMKAYLFIYLFIYLFLAVLGLRFCARAFSSCSERGPLFIAVRGPLTVMASLVAEHKLQTRRLSSCGSRA